MGSLSLDMTKICLMVLFLLKLVWIPYLLKVFLMLSPSPCVKGITMLPLLGLSLLRSLLVVLPLGWFMPSFGFSPWVLLSSWLLKILLSTLSRPHFGYLHLVSTPLMCCNSLVALVQCKPLLPYE